MNIIMRLLSSALSFFLIHGAASQDCPGSLTESIPLADGTATFYYAIVHPLTEGLEILCARLESMTESWIAFGISPSGEMEGGEAIIGLPDSGTVQKFGLGAERAVEVMDDEKQTLMFTSISQGDGKTIMEFAKYLREDGEHEIFSVGENTFLYALGNGDQLGYHKMSDSFTLDFDSTRKPSTSTTPIPTFGGDMVDVSEGFARTMSPTGLIIRDDPSSDTPAPSGFTPKEPASPGPTPSDSAPAVDSTPPGPTPSATENSPSGAITRRCGVGRIILGAGAAAVWLVS